MKMNHAVLSLLCICLFIGVGCGSFGEEKNALKYQEKNLSSYGAPISLLLQEEAKIEENHETYEKGFIIHEDSIDVLVDIFEELADSSYNALQIKKQRLKEKQQDGDFHQLIQDDSTGFVYVTKDTELGLNYHFFHVLVAGKKQIEVSEGVPHTNAYSQNTLMDIYKRVKMRKLL